MRSSIERASSNIIRYVSTGHRVGAYGMSVLGIRYVSTGHRIGSYPNLAHRGSDIPPPHKRLVAPYATSVLRFRMSVLDIA
eukprot:2681284-Rhodomonas_salina.1